jgi:hypothetical protein
MVTAGGHADPLHTMPVIPTTPQECDAWIPVPTLVALEPHTGGNRTERRRWWPPGKKQEGGLTSRR